MSVEKMLSAMERMTPKTGANVVGVDDFEDPGEELYLVKHCASVAEAEAYAKAYRKKHPDSDPVHVYPAEPAPAAKRNR